MILKSIKAITQALDGGQDSWDDVTLPIPDGLLVIAIDSGVVKLGNGDQVFADLPELFNVHDVITVMQSLPQKADRSELTQFMATIARQNYLLCGTALPAPDQGVLGNFYLQFADPPTFFGPKTEAGWGSGYLLDGSAAVPTVVDAQLDDSGTFHITLSNGQSRAVGQISDWLGDASDFLAALEAKFPSHG